MIIEDIKNKLKGFKSYTVSSKKPIQLISLVSKLQKILNNKLKVKIGKKSTVKMSQFILQLKPLIIQIGNLSMIYLMS